MALVTPLNASARCTDANRAVGVWLRPTTRRSIQGLRKPLAPPAAVRVDAVDGTIDQTRQALPCPNIGHRLSPRQSPFAANNNFGGGFVSDNDRVALHAIYIDSAEGTDLESPMVEGMQELKTAQWALRAGARETIYFNPPEVRAAIVTCGGLCPGLNDVVAGLVVKLEQYGVTNILGIMQGLRGFYSKEQQPVKLNGRVVDGIQMEGGTILGTSRGGADMKRIVQRIDMWGLDMVFVVGGNGGNAAANAIHNECERLQVNCCVIGIPKSIDNDILLIDHTFGFETAVAESQHAIKAAKVEASSARKGVGLVKLMGRSSGFIALQASMASGIVDVTLIPEVPFVLDGPNGLLAYAASIIDRKGHCVICVAEGAGQDLVQGAAKGETDASGNPILGDIGHFLRRAIKTAVPDCDMKYIDPTYMIRAIPANPSDQIYCKILAHNAVHAAFCGYTGVTVGLVNTHYCYLPIPALICDARTVDPKGKMWRRLIASTLQPEFHSSEE